MLNVKCMMRYVCKDKEDASADLKVITEEITNNRHKKMKKKLRINVIIRNYPRIKMTLNQSH